MFSWLRNRRRKKLLAEPFPPWWEAVLKRNVGHYPRLSPAEQARLRDATRILVAEKTWEGVGGLFVTDEIKLTVAAQAALLLLGSDHDYYARVDSVVVYPNSFRTPVAEDGWEDDELSDTVSSGQAVYRGPVILSWDEALAEGRDPTAGYNVVLHEFAHQLDFLDNVVNGTPPLGDPALEARWKRVMQAAFDGHRAQLDRGEETFFTEHAAEDETEFFADATEAFYCQPANLRAEYPDVYELLRGYYRVDPLRWFPESSDG
jgi:Mlc titration factor MtfA (ptsG expression regulator)